MNKAYRELDDISILHVNTVDSRGGAARVASSLHEACRLRTKCSFLAVGYKKGAVPDTIRIPNNDCRLPYGKGTSARFPGNLPGRYFKRFCEALRRPLRFIKDRTGVENFDYPASRGLLKLPPSAPDILHCHNLHGGYFDLEALPYLSGKVPTIITLHDAWLLGGHCAHSFECERWKDGCGKCPHLDTYPGVKRDATAYNWRRKRDIYARSRLYIAAPCEWLMRKVEQSILEPAIVGRKIIPNGVDLDLFSTGDKNAARKAIRVPAGTQVLLFVSDSIKNTPWRDYAMIEKVMARLSGERPDKPLIMLCVGAEKDEKVRLSGNAEIRLLKSRREPCELALCYQAADLFLFPSMADTFPLAVIEAMACGVPVVATAVGGIPEQVEEGHTGFLVPPGDAARMAGRALELLDDEDMRQRFGRASALTAQERFDLKAQVAGYLSWYREILADSPGAAGAGGIARGGER